jgi:uncharacterized protein (TIGR02118 family)
MMAKRAGSDVVLSRPSFEVANVLIRSGLIQNFDHIDVSAFSKHWLEVHGPLAAKYPNLRGYLQNHIVGRGDTPPNGLHRIDGISQLWFDDVEAMNIAMESQENQACIADISGFLARVTLAIQDPGVWLGSSRGPTGGSKLMAVYAGEERDFAHIEEGIAAAFDGDPTAAYRINRIISGQFIVDPSVARSDAKLLAVLEAYLADDIARSGFLKSNRLVARGGLAPAALLAVTPHVMVRPPD